MAGSLIPLDGASVPAVFRGRRSGMLDHARAGVQASFAVVSYRGRNWRLKHRGEETLLRDAQGRPIGQLDVVIVGVAPGISKIYYERSYVEGDDNAPDCFSLNGVTPDDAAPKKQNATCGDCKHNAWGSRITDAGKRAKSCQDSRRIAIVPLGDIENETLGGPMLLRIPPTSLPNLARYADFLALKGADMPVVGTRLSFDELLAYPKIEFEALGFLSDAQAEQVVGMLDNPLIDRMLHDAGPIESARAPAGGGEIPGKPPAAMGTVTRLPARRASGTPTPEPTTPEPPPPPVEEPEEEEPPPPPTARTANPFAAATRSPPAAAAAAPPPATAPAPRQRRTASATQAPPTAPPDLESAIDDLLTDVAS